MSKFLVKIAEERTRVLDNFETGLVSVKVPVEYVGKPVSVVVWTDGHIRKEVERLKEAKNAL